jgi:uncharacterized membrane protein
MQGIRRRVVYVTLYEGIAVVLGAAATAAIYGVTPSHAGALSVAASTVAMGWNLVFNALFERWEARQPGGGRGLGRRIVHALGFEGGLALMLVPLVAWWLGVGLVEAFVLDLGFLAFFLLYTFAFNLGFDRVFGLPDSAQPRDAAGCCA